jgi:hypothetical protein
MSLRLRQNLLLEFKARDSNISREPVANAWGNSSLAIEHINYFTVIKAHI